MINAIHTAVPIPYAEIEAFCERHHIAKLWLFGSILRDDFTIESDVDVIVEFDQAHIPGWEFYTWHEELAEIFGRPVDLSTPNSLSKYIRAKVMESAQVVYDAAG